MKSSGSGNERAEVFVPEVGSVHFRTSIDDLRKTNLLDEVVVEVERAGISPGSRLLECGCGTGVIAHELSGKFNMVGIDISRESVLAGREAGLKVDLCVGDVHKLPFADNSFDLVYFYSVLTYVRDPAAVLAEVSRVLKKDGVFLFYEFNSNNPWVRLKGGWGSRKLIAPREYIEMLEGSFSFLEVRRNVNYIPTSLTLARGAPFRLLLKIARFLEKPLKRMPLLKRMGGLVFVKAIRR